MAANRNITIAPSSTATFDPYGHEFTVTGAIGGGGALACGGVPGTPGLGTLVLAGSNTYSGGTFVNGGALEATTTAALPASSCRAR